jgi:signal transduction histidine kinase
MQALQRIIRSGKAATDIVTRIRALFAQTADARIQTDIARLVGDAGQLLDEELLRHGVTFGIEVDDQLPTLQLDRVQIQQTVINLVRNGIEAIGPAATARTIRIRIKRVGDVIQTSISDTGPGIVEPSKIFEPFYTTKGHGMGMGLAICRSIITSHGGELWVEKNEPNGAVFIFTLPIIEPPAAEIQSA